LWCLKIWDQRSGKAGRGGEKKRKKKHVIIQKRERGTVSTGPGNLSVTVTPGWRLKNWPVLPKKMEREKAHKILGESLLSYKKKKCYSRI